MNDHLQTTITTAATNAVLEILDQQPWYRRYANTITTAAGGIVTFGTWLATAEIGLPKAAQVALGAVVLVASVVATRATKNGVTPRGNRDILDAIIPSVTEALQQRGGLDQLVQEKANEVANSAVEQATKAATSIITGGLDAAKNVPGLGGPADALGSLVSEAERAFLGRGRR